MTTYGEKLAQLETAKNTFNTGPDNIRRLTYELCNLDNNKVQVNVIKKKTKLY